jgi:hypothetical protein
MPDMILVAQLFSTLAMVGLIWFVQLVHYPLFVRVGQSGFHEYEVCHQRRTTVVVAPLMLLEALSTILLLWIRPAGVNGEMAWVGLVLLLAIWASTYLLQVPAHAKLAKHFDLRTHRWLVLSNWVRTAGWTARGLLVCMMCVVS